MRDQASPSPFLPLRRKFFYLCRYFLRTCVPELVFCILFAVLSAGCAEAKSGQQNIYAGYRTLSSSLPAQRLMVHMGVWYPTLRKPGTVKAGGLSFRAARNAPVMQGPWPVILLSHDVTGNAWSHHDIAAALACRGYIVAAPTHDHDNGEDMSLLFSDRELPLRALQIKSALDILLEHPQLGKEADRSRIAFLGFGMPSSAGLLLAGASTTPDEWPLFCKTSSETPSKGEGNSLPDAQLPVNPEEVDPLLQSKSPWCSSYLAEKMSELVSSMKHRTQEREEKSTMMNTAVKARVQLFQRLSDAVMRNHQRQQKLSKIHDLPLPPVALPLLPPLSHSALVSDSRFQSMIFVSPGYSMVFSKETLEPVHVPCLFIGAEKERWNIPLEQAERFASMLEKSEYLLLRHADAPSLQSSCPETDPAYPLLSLCASVDTKTRETIHLRLVSLLHEFLSRTLAVPSR